MRRYTIPGEYEMVAKEFVKWGMAEKARRTHLTPMEPDQMVLLTRAILGKVTPVIFRGKRAYARYKCETIIYSKTNFYHPTWGIQSHRLGVVLHECAHILNFREHNGRLPKPHGVEFSKVLRKLIEEHV